MEYLWKHTQQLMSCKITVMSLPTSVGVSPSSWVWQWVRVHKARVQVRFHQARVWVHQVWVQVHWTRVRVRVHWTRVRVRVRVQWVRVRVQQKSEWVRTWVQTQPTLVSPTIEKCFILTLFLIIFAEPCIDNW